MSKNNHIRDFLTAYYEIVEPGWAVMLSGEWGSGKTWFIKNFIEEHSKKVGDKYLYVTLNGMANFSDLETELYVRLHPLLGSKHVRTLGRLLRGAVKATTTVDIYGAEFDVEGVLPEEKLAKIQLKPDQVLVLDDLERCCIPTPELLGYINQFIEHGGVKVIMLANESEIIEPDGDVEHKYSRIKEKLFGRTFKIEPESEAALTSFVKAIADTPTRKFFEKHQSVLLQAYECSGYHNLRLVKHSLWEFARLHEVLAPKVSACDPLMECVLALFLAQAIEIKNGALSIEQLPVFSQSWAVRYAMREDKDETEERLFKLRSKYEGMNLDDSLIPMSIWSQIFLSGSIPASELNASLLNSHFFADETMPDWMRLVSHRILDDKEFDETLEKVVHEWDTKKYSEVGVVLHVAGVLLALSDGKLYSKSRREVIDYAKGYVDHLISNKLIELPHPNRLENPLEREAYHSVMFFNHDASDFKELLNYVDAKKQNAFANNLPEEAAQQLELMASDPKLFMNRMIHSNHEDNKYFRTPLLQNIEPEKFVKQLLKVPPRSRRDIGYVLRLRYEPVFSRFLLDELEWLKELNLAISKESANRAGTLSGYWLSELSSDFITPAITMLEASKKELEKSPPAKKVGA